MSKHISVLLTNKMDGGLAHDFFSRVIDSFKNTCESNGYMISFLNSDDAVIAEKSYIKQIQDFNISGLFIANFDANSNGVEDLLVSNVVPIVTIDYKTPRAISISSDNVGAITELVDYVYSMGHRRIAFMVGDSVSLVSSIRKDAFIKRCKELGIKIVPEYIKEAKFRDMGLAARCTEELLSLPVPPTCIFYTDDYAAVGGINVIRARGLEAPSDISYCGFDGINLVGYFEPRITTIKQDVEELGRRAAYELIDLIENEEMADGSEIIVPAKLEKGVTVGRIF